MKHEFYRFQMFVTKSLRESVSTRAVVGAAYLREGHRVYSVKLWMFPAMKFYLMPDKEDKARMLIFTRELKKDLNLGGGKYFWNLIGQGSVNAAHEVIRLQFDLLETPIYMSIFPSKAHEMNTQELTEMMDAS